MLHATPDHPIDAEVRRRVARLVFELNLHLRILALRGHPVALDTVERTTVLKAPYLTVLAPGLEEPE